MDIKKVASNIDVVLSIGDAIAGILDIAIDKKLNNYGSFNET